MDGNHKPYDYVSSSDRIIEILDQPADQFEETDSLSDRDRLTYTNGFYAYCSAVFVDIRDSAGLTKKYTRPRLAKLYRAFISEMVAVLNGHEKVREVNIVGDCVWAVYNTPLKADIDSVFLTVAYANTLRRLLNLHLGRHDYEPLGFGVGVDYGRALMIKAGYKGSGLNDVLYMGDVVNHAAHLAHKAGRPWTDIIWAGETFAQNLNQHHQGLLASRYDSEVGSVRTGSAVVIEMDEWVKEQ